MFILNYLNKLVTSLYDESIPGEGKLALALFMLCIILLLSYINTIFYFIILISLDNKTVQNWINQWDLFKKIVNIYRKTRIGFLIFEISLSLFIILFILYYSHKIYSFFLF